MELFVASLVQRLFHHVKISTFARSRLAAIYRRYSVDVEDRKFSRPYEGYAERPITLDVWSDYLFSHNLHTVPVAVVLFVGTSNPCPMPASRTTISTIVHRKGQENSAEDERRYDMLRSIDQESSRR
jgi:hypothetical protein